MKWPDFPSLKHLARPHNFCSCQIFALEGRAKQTRAVVYYDLIILQQTQRVGVRGKQLFKTIFLKNQSSLWEQDSC